MKNSPRIVAIFAALLPIFACKKNQKVENMNNMQSERLDDFVLSMAPLAGSDGVWVNRKKNLARLIFDSKEMQKISYSISGTEIGTAFALVADSNNQKILIREGRGLSLLNTETLKDELAFVPIKLDGPSTPNFWVRYADFSKHHILAPYQHYLGDERFITPDSTSIELYRILLPPLDSIPLDPNDAIGLSKIKHEILNLGPKALTFPGPNVVLVRQKDERVTPSGIRWSTYDFNLKPSGHPLSDFLNQQRDTLPGVTQVVLSEKRPFALLGSETGTLGGHLYLASWKKQVLARPVRFQENPLGPLRHLLLSPMDDHFLVETDDGDLYLGAIVENDSGFTAELKKIHHFDSSNLLSWFGTGNGFVAGVWDNEETDLFVWRLPLPEGKIKAMKP